MHSTHSALVYTVGRVLYALEPLRAPPQASINVIESENVANIEQAPPHKLFGWIQRQISRRVRYACRAIGSALGLDRSEDEGDGCREGKECVEDASGRRHTEDTGALLGGPLIPTVFVLSLLP